MKPQIANYFFTLRSNDQCEFSSFWQLQKGPEEQAPDFKILKLAGIKKLVFVGGEPLLRADLIEVLIKAKEQGFTVELTTNGILYAEKARQLAGLIDRLAFSLDYPTAEQHDRSRGVSCFSLVIQALQLARDLGERPLINFTLTRDSVRFLPEMVELAIRLKLPLYLEPVADFYGTEGFEPITLEYIKYYARHKLVLFNLAVLAFIKAGGNRVILPRCRANLIVLTLLPDGKQVSPCFYNQTGEMGRADICSSCMRWPYMLPSFSLGIDRYFWLNLYSDWINKRKLAEVIGRGEKKEAK